MAIRLIELREDKEAIQVAIERTVETLKDRYDVDIVESSIAIPTFVYGFFVSMVDQLNLHKAEDESVHLNFADLFTVGISHESDEDSEKEGNFTPFIIPGKRFEDFVSGTLLDLALPFDGETIELGDQKEIFGKICDRATKYVERENGITFDGKVVVLATITHEFIAAIIEELNSNKVEDGTVEINMAQLFDIGIHSADGKFTPYLRPGQEFKLLVKDDNVTE